MRNRGYIINHKTVSRLMKDLNLKCRVRIKKYRSYKGEIGKVAPNLIDRNFHSDAPNQKWTTDITEFSLFGKKLYLSPILDMYNGEIVSYNISERPTINQVMDMLDKAFEKISDNVYVNRDYAGSRDEITHLIDEAKSRVAAFFGSLTCLDRTVIIICDNEKLLAKLGGDHDTQFVLFPVKKSYISVSTAYLTFDVLAHELTHAELYERLSGTACRRVPTWFNEGIALQNDYREQYGPEAWAEQTDNGKNIVAHEDMDTAAEFYSGTKEDRRFRYLNAKHDIAEWLEKHGLQGFMALIDSLNGGEDFSAAYGS